MNHLTDRQIQDCLDEGLQASSESAQHLKACESCRVRMEWYRELAINLKKPPAFQFSPGFSGQVIRTIQSQNESQSFWLENLLTGGCVVLGMILSVIYIDWSFVKAWALKSASYLPVIQSPALGESGSGSLVVYFLFITAILILFKIADKIWTRQQINYHKPVS